MFCPMPVEVRDCPTSQNVRWGRLTKAAIGIPVNERCASTLDQLRSVLSKGVEKKEICFGSLFRSLSSEDVGAYRTVGLIRCKGGKDDCSDYAADNAQRLEGWQELLKILHAAATPGFCVWTLLADIGHEVSKSVANPGPWKRQRLGSGLAHPIRWRSIKHERSSILEGSAPKQTVGSISRFFCASNDQRARARGREIRLRVDEPVPCCSPNGT